MIFTLITGTSLNMTEDKSQILFDFKKPETARAWISVNDNVMGGVSEGKFKITENKTLQFYGNLSLANNGGFASVRSTPSKLLMQKGDSIMLRIKGDGREYTLNLYTSKRLTAFAYRHSFATIKDEWIEVSIPLEKFSATSFGRIISNAPSINPEEIESIGLLLGDKKQGPFQAELEWIKTKTK